MSSTFSAKAGSVERLKVRMRCGCRRCFSQMRWIVRNDRPTVLAIARPVQWVVSPGGSAPVHANTPATAAGGTQGPALARREAETGEHHAELPSHLNSLFPPSL